MPRAGHGILSGYGRLTAGRMRGPCAVAVLVLSQLAARAQARYSCHDGNPIMWTKEERDLCCINEQIGCPGDKLAAPRQEADVKGDAPPTTELVMTFAPSTTTPKAAAEEAESAPEEASEPAAASDGSVSASEAKDELVQMVKQNKYMLNKYTWIMTLEKTMDNVKDWKNHSDVATKFSCDLSHQNGGDSVIEEWGPFKRHYCCRTSKKGCKKDFLAFDCEAGSNDWQKNWPVAKMAWCCLHWALGCAGPEGLQTNETTTAAPEGGDAVDQFADGLDSVDGLSSSPAFDCEAGFANWKDGWSESKKTWCCDNENKGCSDSDVMTTRRPDKPYNCEDGLRNWEKTWSDAKQGWCCERWERTSVWPAGADGHCCQLVGRGCDAGASSTPPADEPGLDCEADIENWQNVWTVPKKEYCCQRFKRTDDWPLDTKYYCCKYDLACPDDEGNAGSKSLPHDCEAGYPSWQTGWSDTKKDWCCANYKRGCPEGLDCGSGAPSEWPQSKKDYCCTTEGLGCDGTSAPAPPPPPPPPPPAGTKTAEPLKEAQKTPSPAPPSQLGWIWPWAWPAPAPSGPTPKGHYDCRDGSAFEWSGHKKDWCCYHEQRGCARSGSQGAASKADQPYNCDTGYSKWQQWWDDAKKEWCCEHESKGCSSTTKFSGADEPFDCDDGYENWHKKWDKEKVHWCCRFKGKACAPAEEATTATTTNKYSEFDCSGSFTIWERTHPDERVDYCCKHEGKGCLPFGSNTPEDQYNCENGLKSWEISWPVEKVHWCCDTKGICPGNNKTKASGDPYNCDAGFTYEAILHPDTKVKWCCKHRKKGCSLDEAVEPGSVSDSCKVGLANWQNEWSIEKKNSCCTQWDADEEWPTDTRKFCCMYKDIGCSKRTKTTRVATTTTTALGDDPMDCRGGHYGGWPDAKKAYCCVQFREQGLECPAGWDKILVTPTPPPPPPPPPTEDPFDCKAGLDNWEWGWSEPKKKWCCDKKGKGCEAFTTSRRGSSTTTTTTVAKSTTTTILYNCDAGFKNWVAGWSNDKKDYCCKTVNRGCVDGTTTSEAYNCKAGYDNWRLGWSTKKKDFCCESEGRGCGDDADAVGTTTQQYDCKDGYDNWRMGWAAEKKKYCCNAQGRGCEDDGETDSEEQDDDFDCLEGIGMWLTGWSEKKKDFCCKTKGFPCASSEKEKSSSTTSSWDDDTFTGPPGVVPSTSKGASPSSSSSPADSSTTSPPYSCKAKPPKSADYDCHEGLWDWAQGWTDDKKEYCCTNELLWCPEWASKEGPAAADTSDWSADQKDYCCKAEHVGCPTTEGMSKFAVPLRRAVEPRTSPLGLATALIVTGTLALGVVAYRRGVRGGALEGLGALTIYAPILRERVRPAGVWAEPDQANDMTIPLN